MEFVANDDLLGVCLSCDAKQANHSLAKCSRCHYAHYCNSTCQKVDWSKHKPLCSFIKHSSTFFLDQEPRLRSEFITRRVKLFHSFPPNASEDDKVHIEMLQIRNQLQQDIQILLNHQLSFLGFTMLMEGISKDMTSCYVNKALAFCKTPHALHFLFLFVYTLTKLALANIRSRELPLIMIKREVRSIWRLINQILQHEVVALHVITILNEEIPTAGEEGFQLPPLLVEDKTTIKSIMLYFMVEIERLGDDIEGLAWQTFAFLEIFSQRTHQYQEEVKQFKNDIVRSKSAHGERVAVIMQLFDMAKQYASSALLSKGL